MARKRKRRSNGEGCIYELPDGRYAAKIRVGVDQAGKPIIRKKEAKTEKEVKEWLNDLRHSRQNGVNVAAPRTSVAGLLDRWLTDVVSRRCKPKTRKFHESNVKHIRGTRLAAIPLDKLKTPDIQAFLNEKLDSGLSPRYVKHIRDSLRAALNIAIDEWDLIPKNPARKASPGRIEKVEPQPFSADEARQFLEAIKGHKWEALFTGAIALGLRRGEALALRWCDLDADRGVLSIRKSLDFLDGEWIYGDTKTTESRSTLPLLPVLTSAFVRRRQVQQEEKRKAETKDAWAGNEWDLMFTTRYGTPINPRNLQQTFDGILKKAGLRKVRLHDLRHSVATLLMALQVPDSMISRYIRHASIKTTNDLYGHLSVAQLAPVTDALQRVFDPMGTVVGTDAIQ